MKITRFAQSCILIETGNKRILIDPGYLLYEDSLSHKEWSNIDVLLVTHKHRDHCHIDAIKEITKNPKTKFYTTQEVVNKYPELSPIIVKVGDILNFDDVKVEVVSAVHGYLPLMRGEREVHENVGYIIDDGINRAYQTSDTICFKNDYKCDILFVPVCNHGVAMGPREAALFAEETEAKHIIPIHYDNPDHPVDFKQVKKVFEKQDLNLRFLELKESIEV